MTELCVTSLIAGQNSRLTELRTTLTRLQAKPREDLNINLLQMRVSLSQQVWEEARLSHFQIVGSKEAEVKAYTDSNVFTTLQNAYEDLSDFLMSVISQLENADRASHQNESTASVAGTSSHAVLSAKLLRIELTKFDGEYEKFEGFLEVFKPVVHDVAGIPDSAKLSYLKSCLTGKASQFLAGVTAANGGYEEAWKGLNARFQNPRFVVYNELRKLVNLPTLFQESAAALRQFTDEAQRIVRVLSNLQMPVQNWDIMLVFLLSERLDPQTKRLWEKELTSKDLDVPLVDNDKENALRRFATFQDFSIFLEKRSRTLCMLASDTKSTKQKAAFSSKPTPGSKRTYHVAFPGEASACPLCSGSHRVLRCPKFLERTPFQRREEARKLRLCFNCLGKHELHECKSQVRCSTCQGKHHSLIHYTSNSLRAASSSSEQKPSDDKKPNSKANVLTARMSSPNTTPVILATAQLNLVGPHGNQTRVRALLDQGSEISFVSQAVAQLLDLPKTSTKISLLGLGARDVGTARFSTCFKLKSLVDPLFELQAEALILPTLTSKLPAGDSVDVNLEMFSLLQLADPHFNVSDSIDMILGADVYSCLLLSGLRRFTSSSLIAQNTALGWIVSCPAAPRRAARRAKPPVHVLHCLVENSLDETLQRFWNLEEVPLSKNLLTPDELSCESFFSDTHVREEDGRYSVRLPFKSALPSVAAETHLTAAKSLAQAHRRFSRDPKLAQHYCDFMSAYELLGHMERVPEDEVDNDKAWYIPHHAVVQSSPSKYKIRVVFDASRKTHEGQRLNDFLLPGPALQRDLSLVLLNWRRYEFVFTADIVKMFRQIRVAAVDRDSQRILWSPSPQDSPIHYRLNTVTHGTSCAPYLAIRTLLQLAQDERKHFPLGARCIEADTYVDDIFTGTDDLAGAIKIRDELVNILKSAGIELDKWAANHGDLLPSRFSDSETPIPIDSDSSVKTLGLQWNPPQAKFSFTTLNYEQLAGASTKRAVLSNIARLFDPLGWLTPVTITAKILMQDLWILKCEWDDILPLDLSERWLEYCRSLSSLSSLSIDRWLGSSSSCSSAQIHGFCDASSRAYAAAVYLRIDLGHGHFSVSLLTSKTKVAPVKTISIPNLELCGAALLVKLVQHKQQLDFLSNLPVFSWSDSQIVLQWLKKHPCHWKTFVANRVSFIQTELPSAVWAHVPTKENPADLATRGVTPSELKSSKLWWTGPDWLVLPARNWPQAAPPVQALHTQSVFIEPELFSRYSEFNRLLRITAFCLRFISLLQRKTSRVFSFITPKELIDARRMIIKTVQSTFFFHEIQLLETG